MNSWLVGWMYYDCVCGFGWVLHACYLTWLGIDIMDGLVILVYFGISRYGWRFLKYRNIGKLVSVLRVTMLVVV